MTCDEWKLERCLFSVVEYTEVTIAKKKKMRKGFL